MLAATSLSMALWPIPASHGCSGTPPAILHERSGDGRSPALDEDADYETLVAFRARIAAVEAAFNATADAELEGSTANYESARAALLSELGTIDKHTELVTYEVFLLSWRLSATERVRLLTDAMAVQPVMRALVTDGLLLCVTSEYGVLPPEADRTIRGLLGPRPAPIAAGNGPTTAAVSAPAWTWKPDPTLTALDASELAQAWLGVPESSPGMPSLRRRIGDLRTLATFATVTPSMVWGGANVSRDESGAVRLVASHGIFPVLKRYADPDAGHPDIAFAIGAWRLRDSIAELVERIAIAELAIGRNAEDIAALRAADARFEKRFRSIESALEEIDQRLSAVETRLGQIEDYLEGNLDEASRSILLDRFAPILRHDGVDSGPIMSPSDFAAGSLPMARKDADERIVAAVASLGGRPFQDARQFSEWLGRSLGDGVVVADLSGELELIPLGLRRAGVLPVAVDGQLPRRDGDRVRKINAAGTGANPSSPAPIYGIVRKLRAEDGNQHFSVSYYWFHAWNETAAPEDEGNHEGDWGGIDLTVYVPFTAGKGADAAKAEIVDAIYHEHGNPNRFRREALELVRGVRPVVYLERGTNEAHPTPGGTARYKGPWPVDFPVIREHRGNGWHYDTRIGLVDLLDADNRQRVDVSLVWTYKGEWGEFDADEFKWLHGHNTTNPPSPLYQSKFAARTEYIDHR
ncbi:MAG: hypothetical protein ACIAS6_13180 [Phycisphaerales bacterium JB060]